MIPSRVHPLILPLLLLNVISVAVAVYSWRQATHTARLFSLLMISTVWRSTFYAFELLSARLPAALLWQRVSYPGVAAGPVLWLLFAVAYAGHGNLLTRRTVTALFAVPVLSVLLVWTSPWHQLYVVEVGLAHSGPYRLLVWRFGPFYWLHVFYSLGAASVGIAILMRRLLSVLPLYRRQVAIVVLGALLPTAAALFHVAHRQGAPQADPVPIAMAITGLVASLGLYRYPWLDLLPAARNVLVESMPEAWLVLDPQGRVVDLNAATSALIGLPKDRLVGHMLRSVWSDAPRLLDGVGSAGGPLALHMDDEESSRYYDLRIKGLIDAWGEPTGCLMTLRDVTESVRMEERRTALIAELKDALQHMHMLSGLLPICANCHKIRDDRGYWHQVETYIEQNSDAEFTHGTCPECAQALRTSPTGGMGSEHDVRSGLIERGRPRPSVVSGGQFRAEEYLSAPGDTGI